MATVGWMRLESKAQQTASVRARLDTVTSAVAELRIEAGP